MASAHPNARLGADEHVEEGRWRAADRADADRVALVIGHSHVHILRTLMRDAPPLCPVNPRPLLRES